MAINQIEGTENNDFITDTILDDEIFAFGGDDEIEVSSGNDTVDGGEGKDRLVANYSSRTEDLQFSFNSSGYFDWNNNYSMNGSIDVSSVFGNYFSVLNFNNIEDFAFTSGSGNDNIDLGYDNYSDDKIDAGAGDDYIYSGLGNDTIDGGAGFDVLQLDYYSSPNAVIGFLSNRNSGQYSDGYNTVNFSNIEAINVIGSNYNDVLVAVNSSNLNPTMPMPMNQMIDGGEGKDRLVANYADRSEDLEFNFNATSNYNQFNYPSFSGSIDVNSMFGYSSQINFNSIENFTITGGSGNDNIDLGYDNYSDDEVNAGAGDDFINAGLGNDTIDGGAGFDVLNLDYSFLPTNARVMSELTGSNSGEYDDGFGIIRFKNIEALNVIGSYQDDVLVALDSNNIDSMNSLPMNQMIDGGEGDDRLVADYSNRTEDLQFNFNNISSYFDGYNNNSLSGSIDINSMYGNYTSKIDFSNIENFTITGGSGNDNIELGYDSLSDDRIEAGAGDDYISAGLGNDTIDGGTGFDILNLDYTSSPNAVISLIDGNSGQYSNGYSTVNFSNIEALQISGSNYNDVLVAVDSNSLNPSMNLLPIGQMINGGEGKDRLVADYSSRTEDLRVNFNNIYSYFDGYNSSLNGSLDVNSMQGNYNSQINFNNIESFTITSGSGNDLLVLGYDNFSDDEVNAGRGNDFINAGLGNDTIDGGNGFDVLSLNYSSSTNAVTSSMSDRHSGQYSDGINTVNFRNIEALEVFGSNYNDVLVALSNNSNIPLMNPVPIGQMIDGGEGKDRLVADYSNRTEDLQVNFNNIYSYFDGYNSSLNGSLDVNSMQGNYNSQINFNNIESFTVTSGDGNDRLELGYENISDDMIDAGGGDDFIDAGLGNDTIDGGSGFDVLNLNYQSSFDGVTSSMSDRNSGQYSDGYNTVDFDNIEALSVMGSYYNDVLVALTGSSLNSSMNPLPMGQMIDGGEGKDRLVADYSSRSEDLILNLNSYGGSGSVDVYSFQNGNYNSQIDFNSIESFQLDGGKGNDQIDLGYDNFSNDLIDAGEGNDRIIAGFGDDTIYGGKGSDTFVYERGHGSDVISDSAGQNDTIAFETAISFDNLSLDFDGDDLIVDIIDSPGDYAPRTLRDRLTIKDYAIGNSIENIEIDGQIFSVEEMIASDAEPEPEIGTIGEFGRVDNFDHNSQTIQLEHNFENPVVFALPLSRNGGDPSVVRITDIQSDSFTAYLQEAEYRDGSHGKESFSYMVLEAGTWELDNGALLEVGTVDTNKTTKQGWEKINFDADFAKLPVVLSQVQTNLDDEFVRTRQYKTSVDGFRLSMEEEEALRNSGHGQETVGWLAIDGGVGDLGDIQYQAGHTGRRVNHNSAQINFKQEFASKPSLFASLASFYGGDAAGLRYQSLSPTQTTIMLEEDQSRDSEIGHTKENVDFLAIAGTGDLTAIAYEPDFV